jgi:hypothetical protein
MKEVLATNVITSYILTSFYITVAAIFHYGSLNVWKRSFWILAGTVLTAELCSDNA